MAIQEDLPALNASQVAERDSAYLHGVLAVMPVATHSFAQRSIPRLHPATWATWADVLTYLSVAAVC